MMNTDETTPIRGTGKNGKSKPPAKKAAKRSRKPAPQEPAQQEPALQEAAQQEPVQQAARELEQVEQPQEPIAVEAVVMENPPANVTPDVAPEAAAPTAPVELA